MGAYVPPSLAASAIVRTRTTLSHCLHCLASQPPLISLSKAVRFGEEGKTMRETGCADKKKSLHIEK
jgi:hypothetical protein